MDNSVFVVNDEPYCIWEMSVKERNAHFLKCIDVKYFDYLVETHISTDDDKRAAMALRASLHHAMETLFSLIGAYVQAPDCTYAWISKCSNTQLRNLVSSISRPDNTLFTKLTMDKVSWGHISKGVFQSFMPGTDRNKEIVDSFSKFWDRLSYEFVHPNHVDEYNSIKHGFRVRPGGVFVRAGIEKKPGVALPLEETDLVGGSEFGTSFYKIEPAGSTKRNRSLISNDITVNWSVEEVCSLFQLISLSINNVVSALKILAGAKAGECEFLVPEEFEAFDRPWEYSPDLNNFKMNFVLDKSKIRPMSKKELLDEIRKYKAKANEKEGVMKEGVRS